MSIDPRQTPLMVYLKENKGEIYHSEILTLRDTVTKWLGYIPETFPHYTGHSVQHSDEIVLQLSKLLFKDDDPAQPVIRLSAVEVYILVAAAYLHDIGMVVSDKEKLAIIKSPEWNSWTAEEGGGARRWTEIQKLRKNETIDENVRNFLADVQTRFLIAEFVRANHHLRAADLLTIHSSTLGRCAFGDSELLNAIVHVCVAHGFALDELYNSPLYRERCDIRGDKVNLFFLATLLRIGDLLDMSHDRACPLLLNVVCPLPNDSYAHWTKYQRIKYRLTAPDKIEIMAKCQTQDEHRFLQDWCLWLAKEIHEAGIMMSHAARHDYWKAPFVSLDGPKATIQIVPDETATYIPSKWAFVMDERAVIERLINDAYENPYDFVLELIQNGLDAIRCQIYIDLGREGATLPEYPTKIDEKLRERYSLKVSLKEKQIENDLSGEIETRQVLVVEDCGVGMDKDVIQRFLLQIGRSYYRSDEFRRSFKFAPSSHFGVGFLSVFAVSDNIVVETFKPTSQFHDGPIRLTLSRPQNYLLTDRGARKSTGTAVEVTMRKPLEKERLIDYITSFCKKVEFPIVLSIGETEKTIKAERPDQFTFEIPVLTKESAKFVLQSFPIDKNGIEGTMYVFSIFEKGNHFLDKKRYATFTYPEEHLQATTPPIPSDLICVNGINAPTHFQFTDRQSPISFHLDVRSSSYFTPMRRWSFLVNEAFMQRLWKELTPIVEEFLRKHLSSFSQGDTTNLWVYKQRLIDCISLPIFWRQYPETIRFFVSGKSSLTSLWQIENAAIITTTLDLTNSDLCLVHSYHYKYLLSVQDVPSWDNDLPTITDGDILSLSYDHKNAIFNGRRVKFVRWLKSGHLAIDWERGNPKLLFPCLVEQEPAYSRRDDKLEMADLPDNQAIGFYLHETIDERVSILLNRRNEFVQWLERLSDAQELSQFMGDKELHYLIQKIRDSVLYHHNDRHVEELNECLSWIRNLPSIPADLRTPIWKLKKEMFRLALPSNT